MKKITILMLLIASVAILSADLVWDDAVAIRQGVNIEWFRTGTETLDGGAIYVWSDTQLGERDLWAQKVDASGNLVWGEPILIDGKVDRQEDPVITRTSDGNYIIAWIDFAFDLDGDVYAQKINDAGQLLWQEGGKPVCTIPGMQLGLNMEADMDGGAFIIWGDSRNPSKDLYAQRISSTGDPLWTVDGIPVADGNGDEVQNTMLPDGQGGMMLAYTHTYVGESDIYAKHFDANGIMTWGDTMSLAVADGSQSGVRLAALTGGEFMFTWADHRAGDPNIYAQKVNIAGQKLWPDPYIVYTDHDQDPPAQQKNPRIQATSDNAAVIVWEDFRLDAQGGDLFAQKISADGTKLWAEDGIALTTAPFAQIGQRMAADTNGGVYVVWDDLRNGNAPNDDIYAQHLSSTGTELWTAGGKAICTAANAQNGGLVKVSDGDVFINWMDIRNGSIGIYYQVLDASGNISLAEDGQVVFWGLSGDTPIGQYQIISRANDNVIIWQDTRFAIDGLRIFFQILSDDGETLLETNGRPVTMDGGGKQEFPHAVATDDGHIGIVWRDGRTGNSNIYAQLLSPSGERLWGDNGMKITEEAPLSQDYPKISYYNGSFYVGWATWDHLVGEDYYYHVYGQRIQDGQKQWGPDGVMISVLEGEDELRNECTLSQIVDNYYVWEKVSPSGFQTIWAKRVAEDGNAMPGWDEAGLQTTDIDGWAMQTLPVAKTTPQGLYLTWRDGRTYVYRYFAQHISANGQRLWDPAGISMTTRQNEQEFADVTVTDHGIVTVWSENMSGVRNIMAQKFSFLGDNQWGNLGISVVEKDSTQANASIVSFDDNGMMVAWTDYMAIDSDIYYNYINNSGDLVLAATGGVISDAGKAQYEPKADVKNDHAYVIWADGRSSGKTEILGLYAQKLNNQTVSISDPVTPSVQDIRLQQNYPNPFNPHTTIALQMPAKGELKLNIYNAKGQLVKKLFSGDLPKGEHSFTWNGKDQNDRSVASGIYFYTAKSGSKTESRKMLLMK